MSLQTITFLKSLILSRHNIHIVVAFEGYLTGGVLNCSCLLTFKVTLHLSIHLVTVTSLKSCYKMSPFYDKSFQVRNASCPHPSHLLSDKPACMQSDTIYSPPSLGMPHNLKYLMYLCKMLMSV